MGISCRIHNNHCKKILTIPPSYINGLSRCFSVRKGRFGEKKALYSDFWLPDERSGCG
jgi:hypothetical protein